MGIAHARLSDLHNRHCEFVPLVFATQSLHVPKVPLKLGINPLDIGRVAPEVTSSWLVEGVTLQIC